MDSSRKIRVQWRNDYALSNGFFDQKTFDNPTDIYKRHNII